MKEQIVKQENDQINAVKLASFKKKTMGNDKEYDLENATIVNNDGKNPDFYVKTIENEINMKDLQKNFKPVFVGKKKKNQMKIDNEEQKLEILEKKEENIEKKEENDGNLGKRKALTDYVDDFLKDGQGNKEKKREEIKIKTIHKKVKHNLLSFDQ